MEEVGDQSTYLDVGPYSNNNPSTAYIAAAWDEDDIYSNRVPAVFTVGKGGEDVNTVATPPGASGPVTYRNVPLSAATSYSIYVRYDIENENQGETEVNLESVHMCADGEPCH